MQAVSRARPVFEFGLDFCAFLFLPILTLIPLGVTPLAAVAGLCACGVAAPGGVAGWRHLRGWALLFAAQVLWGAVSALWAIDPPRSLVMAARLAGLFAAGLALIAAAPRIAAPERLLAWSCTGLLLALTLTCVQYATLGALTRPFLQHVFIEPRLNHIETGLVLLALPLAAGLALRRQRVAALLLAALIVAVIILLVGEAERFGFLVGLGGAALAYWSRRWFARASRRSAPRSASRWRR